MIATSPLQHNHFPTSTTNNNMRRSFERNSNSILQTNSSKTNPTTSRITPITRRCSFSPPITLKSSNTNSEVQNLNPIIPTPESEIEGSTILARRRRTSISTTSANLPLMKFNNSLILPTVINPLTEGEIVTEIIGNAAEVDVIKNSLLSTPGGTQLITPNGSKKRGYDLNKQYFSSKIRLPTPYPDKKQSWIEEDGENEVAIEDEEEVDEEEVAGDTDEEAEDDNNSKETSKHSS